MSKIKDSPRIGKAAIESLTIAMYDAPFFIYREYVQNAADAIDNAVKQQILKTRDGGNVRIEVDSIKRKIVIEDNGTGIESKLVRLYLGNIALSPKNRYENKGFRGIGRLGGLAYCDRLIYETSAKGESLKSIMTWDAKNLRKILDSPEIIRDAPEVVSLVTAYKRAPETGESHYMRITLEDVTNDALLNVANVSSYLAMVSPLPFHSAFNFAKEIYKQAKNEKVFIDEYLVYLNDNQVFKSYKNDIFKLYKKNGIDDIRKYDQVCDVEFFKSYYEKDLLYWGWFGITTNMKYIPEDVNNEKYIRLRKNNIQIGLKSRLDEFHKKESGSQYFIGEVYAVHRDLQPNARRDFFMESPALLLFTENITKLFEKLHELFYDFSKKNSAFGIIASANLAKKKLDDELERDDEGSKIGELRNDYKRKNEKVLVAKEALVTLYYKHENDTLAGIISDTFPIKDLENDIKKMRGASSNGKKTLVENKLDYGQQDLFSFIVGIIRSTYAKKTAEKLIAKIRQEIQNNYK